MMEVAEQDQREVDHMRNRGRTLRWQMRTRLDYAISAMLTSSSGTVPLVSLDLAMDLSCNNMFHFCAWRADAVDACRRLLDVSVAISGDPDGRGLPGINLLQRNKHGETCLHVAARCGNVAVLELLLARAREMLTSAQLHEFVNKREWRCRMFSALHLATMARSPPCVELLLQYSANAYLLDYGGVSAAVMAANSGQMSLLRLLSREWYADEWNPMTNQKWPATFRREAFLLLLAMKKVLGNRLYRDMRMLLVRHLANIYREQRLRKGIMRSRE
jgi:hypothetical protein